MDPSGVKLLYFSQSYTSHDYRFLEAFVESGIETYYLRLTGESLESRPIPDGVKSVTWIGDTLPYRSEDDHNKRLIALNSLLEELRPDVILAGPILSCTRLVSESGFKPFVAMSWGSDLLVDAAPGAAGEASARNVLARASAAFGDCQQVSDAFKRLTPLPANRIIIFPWGIDTSRFKPSADPAPYRSWPGWENAKVVISLRSWEPIYAIDILVEAFAQVYRTNPSTRLLLAGDGSEHDKIIHLIEQYGLNDVIALLGRIPNSELPSWLASADIYVSSALSDGSSISLLEAMGCGLPVIVTNDYGNLEWIDPGVNGWLVPPSHPSRLASAIEEGLALPEEQSGAMGRRNRAKVKKQADWDANVKNLVKSFENRVQNPRF